MEGRIGIDRRRSKREAPLCGSGHHPKHTRCIRLATSSALALAVSVALAANASAQSGIEGDFGVGLGFTSADGFFGATATGFMEARLVGFIASAAIDGSLGPPTDERYAFEQGQLIERCRDSVTGDIVRLSLCEDFDVAVLAQLSRRIRVTESHEVRVGFGHRFGSHSTLYGVAAYAMRFETALLFFDVAVGSDLIRGGIRAGYPVRSLR